MSLGSQLPNNRSPGKTCEHPETLYNHRPNLTKSNLTPTSTLTPALILTLTL